MRPVGPAQLEESDIPSGGIREERLAVRPELRGFVDSMSHVEAMGGRRVFLPDVLARLLLVRGEPGARIEAYIVGPRASTLRKDPVRQQALTVRLAPGAVPALLAIPASEVTGTILPLSAVWRDATWVDQLAGTSSRAHQHAIVEEALLSRLRAGGGSAIAPRLLGSLDRHLDGRVAGAAKHLGISERHLRRVFHEAVGLSPKTYARVVRLRRALRLAQQRSSTWTRVAVDAGYFDQAHMVAEFRQLTGQSPTGLRRELDAP
jgi:AraC-like DNA-binding protein